MIQPPGAHQLPPMKGCAKRLIAHLPALADSIVTPGEKVRLAGCHKFRVPVRGVGYNVIRHQTVEWQIGVKFKHQVDRRVDVADLSD